MEKSKPQMDDPQFAWRAPSNHPDTDGSAHHDEPEWSIKSFASAPGYIAAVVCLGTYSMLKIWKWSSLDRESLPN